MLRKMKNIFATNIHLIKFVFLALAYIINAINTVERMLAGYYGQTNVQILIFGR